MKNSNEEQTKKIMGTESRDADVFSNLQYEQISLDNEQNNKSKKIKDDQNLSFNESNSPDEKEKLEEAEEIVKKQSTKKKKWLSFIFLLINIGVVVGILTYQLLNDSGSVASFSEVASNINWGIFALLIFVFIMINFLNTTKYWILTYKTTKKNRPALSYKINAIGRYYDNITPFATGGQPFQIFYLSKRGVSGSDAWSIPMGRYVIWQLAFVSFSFVVMIFSISFTWTSGAGAALTTVTAGGWIGFALNSALVLLVGLISISKKVGTKVITGILKLLHKMKIVKDYDKQYAKIIKAVDNYQSTMRKYAKDKWAFLSVLLITYSVFILNYSLPFFIHACFYGFNFALFPEIFIYCVMIDLTASFFPLPGGTGAAELSFTALFGLLFAGGNLFWALIIWRILTYYAYILQGLIILVYDYFIGNKKFHWEEKKWKLQAESRTFEDNHLKDFELSLKKLEKKSKNKKRKIK